MVEMFNFSIAGIGLLAKREVAVGTPLLIESGPREMNTSEPLTAEVRHATLTREGSWLLGCRFSRQLTVPDIFFLG
jgi:hypothetical protein